MHRHCPNCGQTIKPLAFLLAALQGKTLPEAPGVLSCPHCGRIIATAILHQAWLVRLWVVSGAIAVLVLSQAPRTPQLSLLLVAILILATVGTFWMGLYYKTALSQTPPIFLSIEDNILCLQPQGYPITSPHALRTMQRIRVEDIDSVRITEDFLAVYLKPAKAAIDVSFQPALQQRICDFFAHNLPTIRIENAAAP